MGVENGKKRLKEVWGCGEARFSYLSLYWDLTSMGQQLGCNPDRTDIVILVQMGAEGHRARRERRLNNSLMSVCVQKRLTIVFSFSKGKANDVNNLDVRNKKEFPNGEVWGHFAFRWILVPS